jgi:hypothetical protein
MPLTFCNNTGCFGNLKFRTVAQVAAEIGYEVMFTNFDEYAYCYDLISGRENTEFRKWIPSPEFNLVRIYFVP